MLPKGICIRRSGVKLRCWKRAEVEDRIEVQIRGKNYRNWYRNIQRITDQV